MNYITRSGIFFLLAILICVPLIADAASTPPDSVITYTITLQEDGTAIWHVEYRTPLASDEDVATFETYADNISSTYLPRFQDLMQRSAAEAAAATSRPMEADDFSGDAVIQASPTGRFGVVFYSFSWHGFAKTGSNLAMGDALAGGLYLAKENTLIVRYPAGYTISSTEPAPDQVRDGLIWYGLRSFGAGEPRLVFEKSGFLPLFVLVGSGIIIFLTLIAGAVIWKRRSREPDDTEERAVPLPEADRISLEDTIIQLLKTTGGEQYQSEIVRNLGLPKSTVSATLNDLHQRGIIRKIKKGRENLIRLT
jgi:predicted transcriptional regulator